MRNGKQSGTRTMSGVGACLFGSQWLSKIDPKTSAQLHVKDRQRNLPACREPTQTRTEEEKLSQAKTRPNLTKAES